MCSSDLVGAFDATQESAFFFRNEVDVRTEALDERDSLGTHPVGHEDRYGMSQRPADRGKGDAGVAARGLHDEIARSQNPVAVTLGDDVQRHPVLDAAGHVEILGLGVEHAWPAAIGEVDGQEWRVAHHRFEAVDPVAGIC